MPIIRRPATRGVGKPRPGGFEDPGSTCNFSGGDGSFRTAGADVFRVTFRDGGAGDGLRSALSGRGGFGRPATGPAGLGRSRGS